MPYEDSLFYTQNLGNKLDLTPLGGYEESLEALDALLDEEYETVVEAAIEMHPRVSHEVFRYPALNDDDYALIETEMVEDVQEALVDNFKDESGWLEQKLFDLGYNQIPRTPKLSKLHKSPSLNHASDNIQLSPTPFNNPYSRGKEKRESDTHYMLANKILIHETGDQEIILE